MLATVVPDRAAVNNRKAAVGLHFIHISRVFVAIGLGNRNAMPNYATGVPLRGGKIKRTGVLSMGHESVAVRLHFATVPSLCYEASPADVMAGPLAILRGFPLAYDPSGRSA
ncbi:MAG TPA: hypothetical protein VNW24_05755 [Stellaceae bacterium]|jgi:hypothetical protein|nr:hypothetical protein [Stellaceae bacterium]